MRARQAKKLARDRLGMISSIQVFQAGPVGLAGGPIGRGGDKDPGGGSGDAEQLKPDRQRAARRAVACTIAQSTVQVR